MTNRSIVNCIQKSFGYEIKDIHLFIAAFTHKSISTEYNYERLEILGDAIIQFHITEILFFKYPNYTEGDITVMRQNLVNSNSLNKLFMSLNLSEISQQINTGLKGRNFSSDILESLIAAIYIDSNHETIRRVIKKIFKPLISDHLLSKDSKSILQEYLHRKKMSLPEYNTIKSNNKLYRYLITCRIPSENINEQIYSNKVKVGEQQLAKKILNIFNEKS